MANAAKESKAKIIILISPYLLYARQDKKTFAKRREPVSSKVLARLDELLAEWLASVPLPYEGIRVAGTLWSAKSHATKDFLARNRIAYQWLDTDRDPSTKCDSLNGRVHRWIGAGAA